MARDGETAGGTGAPLARQAARDLTVSKVREVANAGFGVPGLAKFWFGEGDETTPAFIREAASEALARGRTFYTHNRGAAELREALGGYLSRWHGRAFDPDGLSITSGGVSALMIAMQAVLDPGDRVVAVTPVWPNLVEIPRILNAGVTRVGLRPRDGRWRLDLEELLAAITPGTRLVLLNSPNNPTGWVLPLEDRAPLLAHCRRLGVWLLTDDVYERLAYEGDGASRSFLTLAEPGERLISANSFSKGWRMTGWRLGWLVAPPSLEPEIGKLLEFNTSCPPDFIQAGAEVALRQGEPYVAALRADFAAKRERLYAGLSRIPGIEATRPDGGMYVLFRVAGETASVALAKRLIAEAGLGLAPGAAFGPESEGWLRWCFATTGAAMDEGLERLARWAAAVEGAHAA
jgi:aspartate/methionine/tyrosine aminotransferase